MNWKCKLLGHDWKYSDRKVVINQSGGHLTFKNRLCKRCYLKQQQNIVSEKWNDIELTKDEIRDIRLKELGI
jgi:hypothetical protein